MRTLLSLSILLLLWPQTPPQGQKPTVTSGSPVGLTFEAFKKLYPSARCFFADDKKAESLQFCIVEPTKDAKILLFDRFSVMREVVTFGEGEVKQIKATLSETMVSVRKYLDEVIPKSDPIRDCVETADEIAKYEADFHAKGIPEPERAHYQDELREAIRAYQELGCGKTSTETLTSWRYHGEQISLAYKDEGITEMKILEWKKETR
jgi:hypothetical protein